MTPAEEAALVDVDRDAMERLFDRRTRKYLDMTGDEFLELVESGAELPDHPMVGHLLLMIGAHPRTK